MLAHLEENPSDAASLLWTLNVQAATVYVVQPLGPYAHVGYERLRQFLKSQVEGQAQRVSVAGITTGRAELPGGQIVPVVVPELRGLFCWSTSALVEKALAAAGTGGAGTAEHERRRAAVQNFLERVYQELENVGVSPAQRAVNFAATNAFQVARVFESAVAENLELDEVRAEPSAISRPRSECWDVKLQFFDPRRRLERARQVYRFTVDVSDVVPVTIGPVRSWAAY
jgi:cyanobactin maturation PatA/PatG family protease